MYYLYFIKDNSYEFYGTGNLKYIMELLNDYIYIHKIYDKDMIDFRITTKIIIKEEGVN